MMLRGWIWIVSAERGLSSGISCLVVVVGWLVGWMVGWVVQVRWMTVLCIKGKEEWA